jgi:hypothetical protein
MNAKVKVKIGSVDSELESSTEVRQGPREGPFLLLFIMQAALETMKWPVPKEEFCIRVNVVTMGERTERKRGTKDYEHSCSLYADDAVLFFDSSDDL